MHLGLVRAHAKLVGSDVRLDGREQCCLDSGDSNRVRPLGALCVGSRRPRRTITSRGWQFEGIEILEALFLEEREPIVVFDADQAELIAIRLLTALWPGLRKSFSVSTFARSPRLIHQKSFDLVFAPRDLDRVSGSWKGRRIDGRKLDVGRHRWSEAIAERVFQAPLPFAPRFGFAGRDVDRCGG